MGRSPRGSIYVQPLESSAERSVRLLDAVHGEPPVQESAAHAGRGQGHALHGERRPQDPGWNRRPVVRQRRPLPAEDHRSDPRTGRRTGLCPRLPDGPPDRLRTRQQAGRCCAGGHGACVLHQFRIGIGRHRAEDRARLSSRSGEGSRTRLIGRERGYHGVNFGGISVGGIVTNRKMFGTLLTGVDHCRIPICLARTHSPRASRRTAPSWRTSWSVL